MSAIITQIVCRNCGAPLRGYKCEYCESVFMPFDTPHIITRELTAEEEARTLEELKHARIMLAPPQRETITYKLWNGETVAVEQYNHQGPGRLAAAFWFLLDKSSSCGIM